MDEEVRRCVIQQKIFRKGSLYRRKNSSEIVFLLARTSTSKDVFLLLLLIRVMEYIECAYPIALLTNFKTNFYSIGIYRVLRCVFLKNQNIVKVMKWARPESSLVVGDLG